MGGFVDRYFGQIILAGFGVLIAVIVSLGIGGETQREAEARSCIASGDQWVETSKGRFVCAETPA